MSKVVAYSGNNPYVFISYSHKDSHLVFPIIEELQKKYNVWFDEGIRFGIEWEDEIAEKLLGCSLFLFFVSGNSLSSTNCSDEIHFARNEGKNFINIIIEKDIKFSKAFELRYMRYQQLNVPAYSSVSEAVADLIRKASELFEPCLADKQSTSFTQTQKKIEVEKKTIDLQKKSTTSKNTRRENYSNGDWYEGEFSSDGKRHGYGEYHYKDGDYYKGEWQNNNRTGYGEYHFKNGNVYYGKFLDNNYCDENATFVYYDGSKIVGEFLPDGPIRGSLIYDNGVRVEGMFDNWRIKGDAVCYYNDGGRIVGRFENGLPVEGTYYWADGSYAEGCHFVNWHIDGRVLYHPASGKPFYCRYDKGNYIGND